MKNVYIDILITVNIIIDYFLLLCTKKVLCINVRYYKIIIASVIGGIASLIALLPSLPLLLNVIIDLLLAMIIVFVAFGKCDIKTYVKRLLFYFAISFVFCGIMIFVYFTFKPSGMGIFNDVIYFEISPILIIILTLLCYYIMLIINKFTGNVLKSCKCNVEIHIESKVFFFSAKIDSGCNVKEPFSGCSVIIAEKDLLKGYEPPDFKCRVIPFETLSGKGIIKGFLVDKVIIDGKEIYSPVYVGVCQNILKGDTRALVPFEITSN